MNETNLCNLVWRHEQSQPSSNSDGRDIYFLDDPSGECFDDMIVIERTFSFPNRYELSLSLNYSELYSRLISICKFKADTLEDAKRIAVDKALDLYEQETDRLLGIVIQILKFKRKGEIE